MISCERCKTENLESSQYCDECGAPLRPNFRAAKPGGNGVAEGDGNNGSHAASKQPEFASNSGAGVNFSHSLSGAEKRQAWLELERGRSVGKKFMLSSG